MCISCKVIEIFQPKIFKLHKKDALFRLVQFKFCKMIVASAAKPLVPVYTLIFTLVFSTVLSFCPTDVKNFNVVEVQTLLEKWNLGKAFGTEFKDQEVDGFALHYLTADNVNQNAYPHAQPFHWSILWDRLSQCDIRKKNLQQPSTQSEYSDKTVQNARRNLLTSSNNGRSTSGIHIRSNTSSIELGQFADIQLRRSGHNVLSVENQLAFCGENGIVFCNRTSLISNKDDGTLHVHGDIAFHGNVGLTMDGGITNQIGKCTYPNDINQCRNASCANQMFYCCDGGGWNTIYQLNLPDDAKLDGDQSFFIDNSADIEDGSFLRVAYHLLLDDEWVFVSMDAFSNKITTTLALSTEWTQDSITVKNLNIISNAKQLRGYSGMISAEGILEIRPDEGIFQLRYLDGTSLLA